MEKIAKGDKWCHGDVRYTVTTCDKHRNTIVLYVDSLTSSLRPYNCACTIAEFREFIKLNEMRRCA